MLRSIRLSSFRSRLFLALLGVTIPLLVLYMGLILRQFTHFALQVQGDLLRSRLKLWTYTLDFDQEPLSQATQEALHRGSTELAAAFLVLYADGRPRFYASDGFSPPGEDLERVLQALEKELINPTPKSFNYKDLMVASVPLRENQIQALIAAISPLKIGWRHLLSSMLEVALLGLAGAGLLAWLLARSISRPVTGMIQAANRVASGIYDDSPLPASEDELGLLAGAFNNMREQVRQAQQSQRDFLTGISHDLKTPLSVVKGYVSALEDGLAEDEQIRLRALAGIQRETDRMSALIAALLGLARLEAGLVPFNPSELNLAALGRRILNDFTIRASHKNLSLRDELPPNLPTIQADKTQIERVVANLMDNALRFTPDGGTIKLGGDIREGNAYLWVEDSGPGIPPEALERVFDKFFQVDRNHHGGRQGIGLGLAIAREIMIRHKGDIRAENLPGQGARFIIRLPLK